MKKYIYTIVAATAILASCSKDVYENDQPKAITEIGASTSAETRAVVSSSENTKVNWESGDQLGVFGTGAEGAVAYTLDGTGGATSGTFKNASSTITAIEAMMYPYQSTATWAESKLTCEIPTVQTATAGSFDKDAAIMYSIGSSTNATLNYAVAFLKVNIPSGTTNVHAITVYSTTALSGKVDITSTGVAAASAGTETYVTLQADASNGALAEGDYYIAVLPGTLANLSIAYKYTDHTAKAKQGGSSLALEAGHVKAFSANFNKGTVRQAVQLWANGPYFALFNVGATITDYASVTATPGQYIPDNVGDHFAWGETAPYYSSIAPYNSGYVTNWKTGTPPHGNSTYSYTSGYNWKTYCGNTSYTAWDPAPYENLTLKPDYDAATVNWGSAWRMPTQAELKALINDSNTSKVISTYGTLAGHKFVGKGEYQSNSVFFPAAGFFSSNSFSNFGTSSYYWSSTRNNSESAYVLNVNSSILSMDNRNYGQSVRAVLK